jgi:hypothetical protein
MQESRRTAPVDGVDGTGRHPEFRRVVEEDWSRRTGARMLNLDEPGQWTRQCAESSSALRDQLPRGRMLKLRLSLPGANGGGRRRTRIAIGGASRCGERQARPWALRQLYRCAVDCAAAVAGQPVLELP